MTTAEERSGGCTYAYDLSPFREVRPDEDLPQESIELALRDALAGAAPSAESLASLDTLTIESASLCTLAALPELPGLRTLTLRAPSLHDLRGIERLTHLENLYLHGTAVSDLQPLMGLRRLVLLSIDSSPVSDLLPLAGLTRLRELLIERTRVADLSPLAGLVKLHELQLSHNPLADLSPLAALHTVRRLYLYGTRVRTIAPLAGLRSLAVLGLVDCPVEDLSAVALLPALQAVLLARTPVERAHVDALRQKRPDIDFDGLDREPPRPVQPGLPREAELAALQVEEVVAAVVAAAELTLLTGDEPVALRGLVLRGATAPLIPFVANPWGIPADVTCAHALAQVWEPLRRRAPRFLQNLDAELLAIALLVDPRDGALALGYLLPWTLRPNKPRAPLAELLQEGLALLLGTAPGAAPRAPELHEFAIPLALRELQRVHGTLARPGVCVGALETFSFVEGPEDLALFEERCGAPPDRFVTFTSLEQNRVVFDLDRLDGRGDPLVREWHSQGWELAPSAAPFWEWFQLGQHVLASE